MMKYLTIQRVCGFFLLLVLSGFIFIWFAGNKRPQYYLSKDGHASILFQIRGAENSQLTKDLAKAMNYRLNEEVFLYPEVLIANEDIVGTSVIVKPGPQMTSDNILIEVFLTDDGSRRLADFSRTHIGKPLAFILNGKVYTAPIIGEALAGDTCQFFVYSADEAEACRIAKSILGKYREAPQ